MLAQWQQPPGDQGPLTDWPVWVSNGVPTPEPAGACMSGGQPSGPESTVQLYLTPPSHSTFVGAMFEMIIRVNAGAQLLHGVETHINFNSAKLRVVNAQGQAVSSITPGTIFQEVLQNKVNNGNGGTIDFSAGKGSSQPAPAGDFELGRFYFKALAATSGSGTPVTFQTTGNRASSAAYGGLEELDTTTGSTITIR